MSNFNRNNMFKPGEVPVELKDDLLALQPVAKSWDKLYCIYLCRELWDVCKRDKQKFETWVNAFIKANAPDWVTEYNVDENGLNVLCNWYTGRHCEFDYVDGTKFRQEFIAQALANIEEQEKAKAPRAKKMSDTKLYKTLKAKVGAEYMRTTVTPALRKVWNQRDTIDGGADFDTPELICAFTWYSTDYGMFWNELDDKYFTK